MNAPMPTKIGKYDVTDVLGQGGMGIVYKGVDPAIGRKVAIKMMTGGFAENPDLLKRFQREAQSAGTLQHPNIVIIYELGTHEGNPYMAMEYLDGESMENMVTTRKRMSLVDKLNICIHALNGLQYAHAHGIIHRDIKPANVMILKDGTVKIVDFGIARISDNSMTKTGQIVGTINYMSPEQFNGHVVDNRSDLFSAGVMMYEFLTGVLPFDGNETPTVILKILNEPPPPLSLHIQNFPPDLEEAIKKALTKDREERWQTAEDMAFELSRIQEILKKEMVVEYAEQAKTAIEKKEFTKAKDLLQQVLKADSKNDAAKEMMKTVQGVLAVQQRGEQVKQLRHSAEDAFANKMLDDAQSYVEQALKMDKANAELLQMQKMIMSAKARKDQVEKTLRKAQNLKEDGDLDAALKTAEEALGLDPKDAAALSTRDAIAAEIKKAAQQKELATLLDEARTEISARRFTSALQKIRKAEDVSVVATQAGSLRNVLNTAREQEAMRLAADKAAIEVEVALHRETMDAAQAKLDSAIKRFPGHEGLEELQQNARKRREAAGLGDARMVSERAQLLIADGNFEAAVALLEHAYKAAPDPGVKSLLAQAKFEWDELNTKAAAAAQKAQTVFKAGKADDAALELEAQPAPYLRVAAFAKLLEEVRKEQERLGSIEVGVLEARKLIDKGDINAAWNKASTLLKENPTSAMVQQLSKDVEGKRSSLAKEAVEKALKDARSLLNARQASAANRTLMTVSPMIPNVPAETKKAFDALQREIQNFGPQAQMQGDMNATMVAGSTGRASGAGVATPPPGQRTMAESPLTPPVRRVEPEPTPFPTGKVVGAVLAVVLVVGGWFGYKNFVAAPSDETYIEINAKPWAKVIKVEGPRGYKKDVNEETPVRVFVPVGDLKVTFAGPDGKTITESMKSQDGTTVRLNKTIAEVDPNEIVKTSK